MTGDCGGPGPEAQLIPKYVFGMGEIWSSGVVRIDTGAAVLAGEVWVPPGPVRAGVVMVGGSDRADRTNGGYFDAYRATFAGRGLAGLWYDKRGVGESTGDFLAGTLDDLSGDAVAAHRHLTSVLGPAVPVGFFGHSEGGWVALRGCALANGAAFVVTNSCPGITPGLQDRHAIVEAMRRDEVPPARQAQALDLYDALMAAAADRREFHAVDGIVTASAGRELLESYLGDVGSAMWPLWSSKSSHDPLLDHAALTCPHLAVFGALDPMVPVAESIAAFASSATAASRPAGASVTIHVAPSADHRLLRPGDSVPNDVHLSWICDWIDTATRAVPNQPVPGTPPGDAPATEASCRST